MRPSHARPEPGAFPRVVGTIDHDNETVRLRPPFDRRLDRLTQDAWRCIRTAAIAPSAPDRPDSPVALARHVVSPEFWLAFGEQCGLTVSPVDAPARHHLVAIEAESWRCFDRCLGRLAAHLRGRGHAPDSSREPRPGIRPGPPPPRF